MKTIFSLLAIALLCSCTTSERRTWIGVGGSKADGTVVLGIDVHPKIGISETHVEWDIGQANEEANRKCRNWGYSGAEMFNDQLPVQLICHPQGISPCWSKTYRIAYQCIGELSSIKK